MHHEIPPSPRSRPLPSAGRRCARFTLAALLCIFLFPAAHRSSAQTLDLTAPTAKPAHTFKIGDDQFLLDGQKFVIRCGEMHFARIPPEYWRHRLKMAKAMGLNTVCAYFFWNFHEWEEGKFDWTGWRDAAEFCRIAQEEGLWVIVRPGPYACAEWEMGGLPWWLVKNDQINLRSQDPKFLEPAVRYLKEVARVLAPLQVTRGGPILMAQVENEYGSYGKDTNYMGILRQALIDGGLDVPLFACNPAGAIASGYRDDLFQVVNFSPGNAERAFETLHKFQKTGPLMNGEYYPAWFDMWGRPHRTSDVNRFVGDLDNMLKNDRSFSIYMAHGGTSFGLWAGADRPFSPDTSSYDYDAPISEAGWAAPGKFDRVRALFAQHLLPGEALPDIPARNPVVTIPSFTLSEIAVVRENLPSAVRDERPKTMEFYDQSRGNILYRTTLTAGPAATLDVKEIHDFAWIFLDGRQVGVMDRRGKRYSVKLPARDKPTQLDILVEAMGRVNFGREIFDRKGLHAPVKIGDRELTGWEIFRLPLDDTHLASLRYRPLPAGCNSAEAPPAYWRGGFELTRTGDTFLDVHTWGKGVVWINGHCLGRFWNIGPTQTLYVPGPWLKSGRNEVIVLDLLGPTTPRLAGLDQPILDQVRLELDFARKQRATGAFTTSALAPAAKGSFKPEAEWQEVRFPRPQKGRYLALEALNAEKGTNAAIAELDALAPNGEVLSKNKWKILWVSSEETTAEPGDADNMLDGQPSSHWHSAYSGGVADFPHRVVIDLGETIPVGGIRYLARSGSGSPGRIKDYRVYVSETPFGLTPPAP
ncbi:MAG: beta-galactosidase [Luteolibacter sp.]